MKSFYLVMIITSSTLAVACLIMSIVFSYTPSLVYHQPIVNVKQKGNLTEFYLRCDLASDGKYKSNILKDCGSNGYTIEPDCNIPSIYSYWYGTFAFGETQCSTGHLENFTATENMKINLIALASSMMIIGMFLFSSPLIILYLIFE